MKYRSKINLHFENDLNQFFVHFFKNEQNGSLTKDD